MILLTIGGRSSLGNHHPQWRWALRGFVFLIVCSSAAAILPYSSPLHPAAAQAAKSAQIEGTILDQDSGKPISNARIVLADFNLETESDERGQFRWLELSLPEPVFATTIIVEADGYGTWQMEGVRLLENDILYLDVDLTSEPQLIQIPEELPARDRQANQLHTFVPSFAPSFNAMDQPIPETIRVIITGEPYCGASLEKVDAGEYSVEEIDFKEYAKHVLPNEWYGVWPREALRAGGIAVKSYAWYYISIGGKWKAYDADVIDSTCDQYYNPNFSYGSTDRAVDYTWPWRLTDSDGSLFLTHYLDTYTRCVDYGWAGNCLGQQETYYHAVGNNGYELLLWDEMVLKYYWGSQLSYVPPLPRSGFMLHFFGNGYEDLDRVKILIDDEGAALPADVGEGDFTLEWWMKAQPGENLSPPCTPVEDAWMSGNILFDRDVLGAGDDGEYGVSLADGKIAFGVANGTSGMTLCGSIPVADSEWRHVAVTRTHSDGMLRIFIDGELDDQAVGPSGPISYREGRETTQPDQDPYLVIGARKGDVGLPFIGWIEDVRLSDIARYEASFPIPSDPLQDDANTLALYHFDEGHGNTIGDDSAASSGPSDGIRNYGGDAINGPEWEVSDLFPFHHLYFPVIQR